MHVPGRASSGMDRQIDRSCRSWQKQLRTMLSMCCLNDSWASRVTPRSLTVSEGSTETLSTISWTELTCLLKLSRWTEPNKLRFVGVNQCSDVWQLMTSTSFSKKVGIRPRDDDFNGDSIMACRTSASVTGWNTPIDGTSAAAMFGRGWHWPSVKARMSQTFLLKKSSKPSASSADADWLAADVSCPKSWFGWVKIHIPNSVVWGPKFTGLLFANVVKTD